MKLLLSVSGIRINAQYFKHLAKKLSPYTTCWDYHSERCVPIRDLNTSSPFKLPSYIQTEASYKRVSAMPHCQRAAIPVHTRGPWDHGLLMWMGWPLCNTSSRQTNDAVSAAYCIIIAQFHDAPVQTIDHKQFLSIFLRIEFITPATSTS